MSQNIKENSLEANENSCDLRQLPDSVGLTYYDCCARYGKRNVPTAIKFPTCIDEDEQIFEIKLYFGEKEEKWDFYKALQKYNGYLIVNIKDWWQSGPNAPTLKNRKLVFDYLMSCYVNTTYDNENTPKENDLIYFIDGSSFQLNPINSIAIVSKVTKYDKLYSFEITHAKILDIITINPTMKISNELVLRRGDSYKGQCAANDVRVIFEARGAHCMQLQTLASLYFEKIQKEEKEREYENEIQEKEQLLDDILTIILHKLRRRLGLSNNQKVKQGEETLLPIMFEMFWKSIKNKKLKATKTMNKNVATITVSSMNEWYKLWDENVFKKIKLLNGNQIDLHFEYLNFSYHYGKQKLVFEAKVLAE